DAAVRHALAAGDAAWAARLIEQHFDAVMQQGQRATIHRWLALLPADLVHARARLNLAQAWMAVVGGHSEAARAALDAPHPAPAPPAEKPFEPSVGRGASLLANTPAAITVCQAWLARLRGEAERTTFPAAPARGELDDGDWHLTHMRPLERARSRELRGRL